MSEHGHSVLLVEDERINPEYITSILESNGFSLSGTVSSGETALESLEEDAPEIILMGIRLEGEMDGVQTNQRIQKDHNIPVVYLTDQSSPELAERAVETESFGFLNKPIDECELVYTLKMVLNRNRYFLKEKKQVEDRLELSQDRYARLVDAVPDFVYQLDPDGEIEFIDDSIQELGYEPRELIGEPIETIITPEDREFVLRKHVLPSHRAIEAEPENGPKLIDERRTKERSTEGLQVRLLPKELRDSDGNIDHSELPVYEVSASGLYNNDTNGRKDFLGTVGSLRPITERLRRKNELDRQVDFFKKAEDIATVGAWEYEVRSDELRWTDKVYELHALSQDVEVSPEFGVKYYHPDDRPRIKEAFDRAVEEGEPYDLTLRLIDENDQERWVQTRGEPQSQDGEIVRVRGTIQDVTDRKKQERELQELTERLQLAVEGAELGIWDWDMTTDEVEFNEQWAQMIGYSLDELEPHLNAWEKRVHPEDIAEVEATLEDHIAGETDYYDSEHRLRTADGEWKWIRDVGKIFERTDDGDPVRAVGIHIDIDDRKQREAEFKEQQQRFKSLFEQAPIGLWEEDWSGAKAYLEDLQIPPSEDLQTYLKNHPDTMKELTNHIEVLMLNRRVVKMLSADNKDELKENFEQIMTPSSYQAVQEEMIALWEGTTTHTSENTINTFDGETKEIRRDLQLVPGHEDDWSRVFVSYQDVTERKSLQEDLVQNQEFLREMNRISTDTTMAFEAKIEAILRLGCERFDCSYGFVTTIEDGSQRIEHAVGDHDLIQTGAEAPLSKTYCRKTIQQDEPLVLNDSEDVRDTVGTEPLEKFQLSSYIGARLYVGDDLRGTVCFASIESRDDPFNENHEMMLTHIAQWVQFKIERKERVDKLHWRTRAIEEAPVGVTMSDPGHDDNPVIYANKAFSSLTGYSQDESIGRNCRYLQGEETDPETVAEIREAIDSTEPVSVELKNYTKDGTEFWNKLTIAPVHDESGALDSFIGFQQDVTERKVKTRQLQESEERFRQLAENIDAVFWLTDAEKSEMLYVNGNYKQIWGRSPGELYQNPEAFLDPIHPDDREHVQSELPKQSQGDYDVEYRIRRPDGSVRWIRDRAFPVENEDGEVYRIAGIAEDITKRKNREKELQTTIEEKNTLLKEVHHRVKNNMQIVSSMMGLQKHQLEDDEKRELLTENQNRLQALKLIHQHLYSMSSVSRIDFQTYVEKLIQNLLAAYSSKDFDVRYELDLDEIEINFDQSLYCGLLLQELVTNSFEHAFPVDREEQVVVKFNKLDEETMRLIYEDNGTGLPGAVKRADNSEITFKMIHVLAEKQLGGTFEYENLREGTRFEFEFSM